MSAARALSLFLAALALQACVALAVVAAAGEDVSLDSLAVYNDGHLYLEIARSFPLPYSPDGPDYLGHAPGYPALVAAVHALTPDAWVSWGMAALLAAWLCAALSAPAFHALSRELGVSSLWPTLAFVTADPFRVVLGSSAHAEPTAELFALLCFLALARDRLGWSVALLSCAALCRFPAILLGAPLAFVVLVTRRRRDLRSVALLSVPLWVLLIFNLYLRWRVPGFVNVFESHAVFWETRFEHPFSAVPALAHLGAWWREAIPLWAIWPLLLTYASACIAGLRPAERERWYLPLWIAMIAGFHASLSGVMGALALPRLTVLAWAPSVLVLARLPVAGRGRVAAAVLCTALVLPSALLAERILVFVVRAQPQSFLPDAVARLDDDEPRWIDFEAWRAERRRELRQQGRGPASANDPALPARPRAAPAR